MDGENSYESDISESWSHIDVNLNEELFVLCDNSSLENLKEVKNVNSSSEMKCFSQKDCKKNCDCKLNNSDSNQNLNHRKPEIIASCEEEHENKNSDDGGSESCDGSIEVLEEDENDRDAENDRLDISILNDIDFKGMDQSNEEKSHCCENVEECSFDNSFATVIRRKRRRQRKSLSESSSNSLNSDLVPSYKCVESHSTRELKKKKNDYDLKVSMCKSSNSFTFSHCKKWGNTIVSLSIGIFLTGISCIAIGHILGVYDDGNSINDLMEAVKKLQMENDALHSRLTHLNRAFMLREMNLKLEQSSNEKQKNKFCLKLSESEASRNEKLERSGITQSEIHPRDNSIEWLMQARNSIEKPRNSGKEINVDPSKVSTEPQEKVNRSNRCRENEVKLTGAKELNVKISKVVEKILEKLSSSHTNLESLYGRLTKLKKKLNKKLRKIFCEEKLNEEEGSPATEKSLFSLRWSKNLAKFNFLNRKPNVEKEEITKPRLLYEFPKPENYYTKRENDSVEGRINSGEIFNGSSAVATNATESHKRSVSISSEKGKSKNETLQAKTLSDQHRIYKQIQFKKLEKQKRRQRIKSKHRKRLLNRMNVIKKIADERKKRKIISEKTFGKNQKKNLKPHKENFFSEENKKNLEKVSRFESEFESSKKEMKKNSMPNDYVSRSDFDRGSSESKVSRDGDGSDSVRKKANFEKDWAKGREEIRRIHVQSDWQFDRARARKELRKNYSLSSPSSSSTFSFDR